MAIDNLPACGVMTGDDIKDRVDLLVNQSNDPVKGNDALKAKIDSVKDYTGKDVRFVAGVIRNDGIGWELLDDAFHTGLYIDSVSNDNEKITINYTSAAASKVLTFVIGCDETYSSLGYTVGSSVAVTKAEVFVSRIAGNSSSALMQYNSTGDTVTIPFGQSRNIDSASYDPVTQTVTVNHPSFTSNHLSAFPAISPRRGCKFAKIDGLTTTSTSFYFVDGSGNKVSPSDGDQFLFNRGSDYIAAKVDPATVNNPIGNFWFVGVLAK